MESKNLDKGQLQQQTIAIEDFYMIIGELYWNLKQSNQAFNKLMQSKLKKESIDKSQ